MLERLGYDKNVKLEFNANRLSGLWLLIIGSVIIIATIVGGKFVLNPIIFMTGFGVGFYLTNFNKAIVSKFMDGELSKFQEKMANIGVLSLFPLIFVLGGSFIPRSDWRMMWLGALLATGIHFLPFYFSHGKSMIYLATICSVLAIIGMFNKEVPFIYFGVADGIVKILFGVNLLFFQKRNRVYKLC
ncbi:DUF6609 family protein [Serpentinicella alkaliphila]|uniref:Uncharacterized protein n=1 Tax=Serpentinicella alkaliphila TaxID=1734049 RepID=A0A4R2TRY9_9FIRM|nr:DUF6609 family protein [Serpentinicella alkaliphila]QUH24479.1 hypothetical protein HZR23_00810 [Serpentinicella alkaliphila]TCQ04125.1 hypothetical protein EDD79_10073 [Serpentinicella alkaliphila]